MTETSLSPSATCQLPVSHRRGIAPCNVGVRLTKRARLHAGSGAAFDQPCARVASELAPRAPAFTCSLHGAGGDYTVGPLHAEVMEGRASGGELVSLTAVLECPLRLVSNSKLLELSSGGGSPASLNISISHLGVEIPFAMGDASTAITFDAIDAPPPPPPSPALPPNPSPPLPPAEPSAPEIYIRIVSATEQYWNLAELQMQNADGDLTLHDMRASSTYSNGPAVLTDGDTGQDSYWSPLWHRTDPYWLEWRTTSMPTEFRLYQFGHEHSSATLYYSCSGPFPDSPEIPESGLSGSQALTLNRQSRAWSPASGWYTLNWSC
jgi:hypothetical protein